MDVNFSSTIKERSFININYHDSSEIVKSFNIERDIDLLSFSPHRIAKIATLYKKHSSFMSES